MLCPNYQDPSLDPHSQNRGGADGTRRSSQSGVTSNMKKASSTTNIVDDLSSIFGGISSMFYLLYTFTLFYHFSDVLLGKCFQLQKVLHQVEISRMLKGRPKKGEKLD